jgi:hypothetical protein
VVRFGLTIERLFAIMVNVAAGLRLTELEGADIGSLSAAQATAALRGVAVIRGKADQLEAAIVRRLNELHAAGQAIPAADTLGHSAKRSRRAAEQAARRAGTLGEAPQLNAALGKGKVGAEHADALATAAGRLDEQHRAQLFAKDQQITEHAASSSPESFRRWLTKTVDSITDDDGLERAEQQQAAVTASIKRDDDTGMHHLFAKLTPEQGNRVRRRLDAEAGVLAKRAEFRRLRRDQLLAHALDRLICGTGSVTGMAPPEIAVLIDLQTLVTEERDGRSVCELSDGTEIPVETARRHACDANIIPVVLGGDSMPLDVGRARRLATPPQRTALRAMYRTCAIVGCDQHFDNCHIHHLTEWDDLGDTDIDNLLPLCSHHHHRVHEGRWQLQLDSSTRQLTVHLPDGTLHTRARPDLLDERTRRNDEEAA